VQLGPFDWIFVSCVGVSAVYQAVDTAVKQRDPKATLGEALPAKIKSPKWNYLPLGLIVIAILILIARGVGLIPGSSDAKDAQPILETFQRESGEEELMALRLDQDVQVPQFYKNLRRQKFAGVTLTDNERKFWSDKLRLFDEEWSKFSLPQTHSLIQQTIGGLSKPGMDRTDIYHAYNGISESFMLEMNQKWQLVPR
jgi:hypothetical protein